MSLRVNIPFSGGGWRESEDRAQDRAVRFRKGRKPGDVIQGVFVRPGPPGHGWVEVDGHPLLARLDAEPAQGQVLHFVIERLEPEIMLRLLDGGGRNAPAPATLLGNYIEARDQLDAMLHARLWNNEPHAALHGARQAAVLADGLPASAMPDGGDSASPHVPPSVSPDDSHTSASAAGIPQAYWLALSPEHRLALFAAFVGSDAEVAYRYLACQKARLAIAPLLRQRGIAFMQHMPWLHPAARGLDVAFASGSGRMQTVFTGATLPGVGPCLATLLWLPPQLGCHLRGAMTLPNGRPASTATAASAPECSLAATGHVKPPLPDDAKRALYGQCYGNGAVMRHGPSLRTTSYGRAKGHVACAPVATFTNMPQAVVATLLSSGPLPAGPFELVARLIAGLESVPLS